MFTNPQARHKHNVGFFGENLAASFLRKKGFKILERNFKARYGELDIIALEGDTLVFIEVKTRIGNHFGAPEEAITPWKLRELVKTAQFYSSLHPELPQRLRIDGVGIVLSPETHAMRSLSHTQNITQ